jgi:LDH2 family malate/lactate/ureidoglycolate dehydrogenase
MRFVTYQCDQGLCAGLAVGDLDQFKATVDSIFAEMRDSTALPGYDPLRISGQSRSDVLAERTRNGIRCTQTSSKRSLASRAN